jgi:hypothetical protein
VSKAPLADWGRIVMHNGVSVQAGHRVVSPRLQAELREVDEIWRATHGTPRPQALGQALNNGPSGCVTSSGPRVLGWGLWARFFQRHLATYLVRADNFYRLTLGSREAADDEGAGDEAWRAHRVRTCELATEYCLGLASALVKAGREAEAATLYQRVVDDETVDRVQISNNSWWLVSYYHRTGQAAKATAVAQAAADVGSAGGLHTMAWLLEQRQFYDRAAELYEQQAEAYNAPQNAIAFYYRMVHVRGVKSYEEQLKTWVPRVFPHGLQRFDPASLTIAPKAAILCHEPDRRFSSSGCAAGGSDRRVGWLADGNAAAV